MGEIRPACVSPERHNETQAVEAVVKKEATSTCLLALEDKGLALARVYVLKRKVSRTEELELSDDKGCTRIIPP
jgi:hypothetical protein